MSMLRQLNQLDDTGLITPAQPAAEPGHQFRRRLLHQSGYWRLRNYEESGHFVRS